MTLRIEYRRSQDLSPRTWGSVIALCDAAFDEHTAQYFANIGPGEHLLGWEEDQLASHVMWIPRQLQPAGRSLLHTAYVEMVATDAAHRGRGHATRLLETSVGYLSEFDIVALAPATDNLYLRLGWRFWRGPLFHRRDGSLMPDAAERAMLLPLERTPSDLDWDAPLSIEWRPGEVW